MFGISWSAYVIIIIIIIIIIITIKITTINFKICDVTIGRGGLRNVTTCDKDGEG